MSINELMYGLMLPSGNDAALLLAEVFGLLIHTEYRRKLKIFDVYDPQSFRNYYGKSFCHVFVNAMN